MDEKQHELAAHNRIEVMKLAAQIVSSMTSTIGLVPPGRLAPLITEAYTTMASLVANGSQEHRVQSK